MTVKEIAKQANQAIEEPINFHINRPLAAIIVDFLYEKTNISPNQVTFASIITGIIAGIAFYNVTPVALFIGAIFFQLSQILDCVDGQLARMKKVDSEFGRILDGIADYIVGFAVFGGAMLGIYNHFGQFSPNWASFQIFDFSQSAVIWLFVIAGITMTLHSLAYDFIKTKFMSLLKTGEDAIVRDHTDLFNDYKKNGNKLSFHKRIMMQFYMKYSAFQQKLVGGKQFNKLKYTAKEREKILKDNKTFFKLWSWMGPNSHFIWVVIAAVMGDLMLSIFFLLIVANIYSTTMLIYTKQKFKKA